MSDEDMTDGYDDDDNEDEYDYSESMDEYEDFTCGETTSALRKSSEVPDGSFKILEYKDIIPLMTSLVKDVAQLLNVTEDVALLLLTVKFRWDKERLIDGYYADSDKVMQDVCGDLSASTDVM